jgi:hypothetical protein
VGTVDRGLASLGPGPRSRGASAQFLAGRGPSRRINQRAAEIIRRRSWVTPNSNCDLVPGICRASIATAVLGLRAILAHSPSSNGSWAHEPRTPAAGSGDTPRPSAPVTTRRRANRESTSSARRSRSSGSGTSMRASAGSSRCIPPVKTSLVNEARSSVLARLIVRAPSTSNGVRTSPERHHVRADCLADASGSARDGRLACRSAILAPAEPLTHEPRHGGAWFRRLRREQSRPFVLPPRTRSRGFSSPSGQGCPESPSSRV